MPTRAPDLIEATPVALGGMSARRRRAAAAVFAVAALLVAGCSGDDSDMSAADSAVGATHTGQAESFDGAADADMPAGGMVENEGGTADRRPPDEAAGDAPAGEDAAGEADSTAAQLPDSTVADGQGRQLRRDFTVTVELADTGSAERDLRTVAQSYGGVLAGQSLTARPLPDWQLDGRDPASVLGGVLVFEIPADRAEEFVDDVRDTATLVEGLEVTSDDVTSQLVDLDARIGTQEELEGQMVELLREARDRDGATTTELVELTRQISQVRTQIEQLEAQHSALASQVAYSTVTVRAEPWVDPDLTEPDEGKVDDEPGWSASDQWDRAVETLSGVLAVAASAGIWLAVVVGPFAAIGALLWLAARRRRRDGDVTPAGSDDGPDSD